ncbi:MAG: hypothetical protein LBH32_02885 [Dysgonamonadaceae bacterium]|jgi:hypothetical protein|nr:hypothetical protein [Dysgonamonadaceae bacterium]
MGNTQTITAKLWNDMVYPGVYVDNGFGGSTDLKVDDYEWTLPSGWRTSTGKTGKFLLGASESKDDISIIPDNFTTGELKVRAINPLRSAGSEYKTFAINRGFSFTAFPATITYGDKTVRNFSVTYFPGITYEWNVPEGWQINGQGSTLGGLNMNSVSITPSFCYVSGGEVKVRLKKDNVVSSWFEFPTQITVPDISVNASVIYQYEEVLFTFKNINVNEIQSVAFSGNGVSFIGKRLSDYRILFSMTGNVNVNISVFLNGCNRSVSFTKQFTINPHRVFISGPSEICTTGAFSINNLPLGATVVWSGGDKLSLTSGQGTASAAFTKNGNGQTTVKATVSLSSCSFTVSKVVDVGVPDRPWMMNGSTIYKGSSATCTMCLGKGTTSLIFQILNPTGSTKGSWIVEKTLNPENFEIVRNEYNLLVNPKNIGGGMFTVKAANNCGTGQEFIVYLTINVCSSGKLPLDPPGWPVNVSIYPNPASDLLTVEVSNTEDTDSDTDSTTPYKSVAKTLPYTIQLWSEKYGLVRSVECQGSVQQISLQGLLKGLYFVNLIVDGEVIRQEKLLVQ